MFNANGFTTAGETNFTKLKLIAKNTLVLKTAICALVSGFNFNKGGIQIFLIVQELLSKKNHFELLQMRIVFS